MSTTAVDGIVSVDMYIVAIPHAGSFTTANMENSRELIATSRSSI